MPIDLETIGYYLFMEEQEQIEEARSRSKREETGEEEEQDEQRIEVRGGENRLFLIFIKIFIIMYIVN